MIVQFIFGFGFMIGLAVPGFEGPFASGKICSGPALSESLYFLLTGFMRFSF